MEGAINMFENVNPKDLEEGRKYLMSGSVGGGLPILIESGKGAVIKDANGKEYIDCTSKRSQSRFKKSPMCGRALKPFPNFFC
jgi:4-aminobutyrate aminotransferase-like enzyme